MSTYKPLGVAVVGCGNISNGYANSFKTKPDKVALVGCFDVEAARAQVFAQQHGCYAYPTLDALLTDSRVECVVNLTIHHAHAEVTCKALEAGKHVHSEKPLATTLGDGRRCVELAERKKLRLSCSPFTFMGEAQQTLLKAKNDGLIGRVLVAYSEMNWGRIESWHPNPVGFYLPGSGPLLDVGVYALTVLTTLLGPVKRVTGFGKIALPERTIAKGDLAGQTFTVKTPDIVVGGLEFGSGVVGRLTASFLVGSTKQASGTELHGENGSLWLGSNHDFNCGVERFNPETRQWDKLPYVRQPFQGVEWGRAVFSLADSLRTGTPQYCTGRQAFHVLETCLGILESAERGRPVEIISAFDPPPPLP